MADAASGRLVLVGTPLGNREDMSPRALRTLAEADLLLCEDTRSPLRLVGPDVELPPRVSCFVGNEHERLSLLLEHLGRGETVAYLSEAGLPIWSDPGQRLVEAAVAAGYEVDVVPGPTAGTVALCLSGFSAVGARFLGFIERSGKAREAALAELVADSGATILYEAGPRVPDLFADLRRVVPDAGTRRAVVGRELTKLHQEVIRGTVAELADRLTKAVRGEVTVVLEGAPVEEQGEVDVAEREREAARATLDALIDPALKPRARAKKIAELTGLDPREVYERLSNAR